jgi:hypothetical protein
MQTISVAEAKTIIVASTIAITLMVLATFIVHLA